MWLVQSNAALRRLLEGVTDGDREKKRPPESAKGKTPGKRTVDESALWPFSSWVVGPDGLLQEALQPPSSSAPKRLRRN